LVTGRKEGSDEDIMSKAQRLAAKLNLENSEFPYVTLEPKVIVSNLNNVGIRLGRNDCEVLNSVISIKNIELDRLTVETEMVTTIFSIWCLMTITTLWTNWLA
jgi:hypothetical protein